MKKLTALDKAFIKYIARSAKNNPHDAFVLLVDAISKGNGSYIADLCRDLGCARDMIKASNIIVSFKE